MSSKQTKLHIGCGESPIAGWVNTDNSWSTILGHIPAALVPLVPARLRGRAQLFRAHQVKYLNARARLPFPDGSVDAIYSCHVIEHMSVQSATALLAECRRVLSDGGVLRLAAPDLRIAVSSYLADGDAIRFAGRLLMAPRTEFSPFERFRIALFGWRDHYWLPDGDTLTTLARTAGFRTVVPLAPGRTTMADAMGIDLWERSVDSLYLEARP